VKRDWLIYLVMFSLALNFGTIGTIVYLRYQDQLRLAAGPPPLPPPLFMKSLWRELKLDEAQRQGLHRLFPEHRRQVADIRAALAQKRQELFELLKVDTTPWSAIQDKIKEISVLQGRLEEEMARFMLEFKKTLNPEQHAAFLKLLQTRLGCGPEGACPPGGPGSGRHRGRGMGRGMGPGMGPGPGPRGGS
jgi:Spy/CpxP family protein refolding chaperone